MATIGKLAVQITADTQGLSTGLKSAGSEVDSFGTRMDGLASKLKIIGPLAAAAGAAFAVGMVRNVANTADALGKLSTRTGVAVEDLSRLQYAASLSDVSTQELSGGITRLSRSMSDAATGTGEAGKAFEAMGITVKEQDGTLRSQVDVLNDIADRFASYQDGAQKSALAQQIFGRSGTQLITVLNGGSQALKSMGEESDRLGNTIDQKTAKAAEQFNDNITRLDTAVGGLSRQIAGPLIQSLADLTSGMFAAFMQGETFFGSMEKGLKRLGAAKDIEEAEKRVAALTIEYDKALKSVSHLEQWEQATHGIMTLGQRLDEAKARLQELRAEADKPLVTPLGAAPIIPGATPAVKPATAATVATGGTQPNELDEYLEKRQRDQDYWAGRLKQIEEGLMNESELLATKHAEDLARLDAAVMSEDERRLIRESLEMEHLDRMGDIEEQAKALRLQSEQDAATKKLEIEKALADERVRINQQAEQLITNAREAATSAAIGLLSALGGKSKSAAVAAIALGKALSIAQIIQNTAVAQMRALAELGPLAGSAAAAKIGVMGKVQAGLVAATGLVQAAGVMSGGSQSLVAGNTIQQSANSASPMQGNGMAAPSMNQTITVQGIGADSLFSGDAVRTLIDRLIDAQRNGARIVLA
jgi:hypothetical protein